MWSIPIALGLLTLAHAATGLAAGLGWYDGYELLRDLRYQSFVLLLQVVYALAVLVLGLSLLGRRVHR